LLAHRAILPVGHCQPLVKIIVKAHQQAPLVSNTSHLQAGLGGKWLAYFHSTFFVFVPPKNFNITLHTSSGSSSQP
jgi:hypothetical protein